MLHHLLGMLGHDLSAPARRIASAIPWPRATRYYGAAHKAFGRHFGESTDRFVAIGESMSPPRLRFDGASFADMRPRFDSYASCHIITRRATARFTSQDYPPPDANEAVTIDFATRDFDIIASFTSGSADCRYLLDAGKMHFDLNYTHS